MPVRSLTELPMNDVAHELDVMFADAPLPSDEIGALRVVVEQLVEFEPILAFLADESGRILATHGAIDGIYLSSF